MYFLSKGKMSLVVSIPSTHGRKSGGKDDSGDFKVSVSSPGELNVESQGEITLCFTNGGECVFL